jgi:UDP-glucose 4-epimerase
VKRALVTGASGFIGRHLVRRLVQEGYQVRVLVRSTRFRSATSHVVETMEGDIRDTTKVKEATAGVDTIFHLAGRTHALSELSDDDATYHAVNVEGTRNVLEGAVAGGVQGIVFASSVKVFGEESQECLDETAAPRPASGYGRSKLEAEELVQAYAKTTGLQGVSLRLPLVYGTGNPGNIYRMVWAIDHHVFPPFPDVPNRRSLVHAANAVEAALLVASRVTKSPSYIVTDRRPYSTRELYEMICRGLGRRLPRLKMPLGAFTALGYLGDVAGRVTKHRLPIDSASLKKLTGSAWYSSEKISRELGYDPALDFEGALPELIGAYRQRKG